jgi:hypothetical protein
VRKTFDKKNVMITSLDESEVSHSQLFTSFPRLRTERGEVVDGKEKSSEEKSSEEKEALTPNAS